MVYSFFCAGIFPFAVIVGTESEHSVCTMVFVGSLSMWVGIFEFDEVLDEEISASF